mmetsp:Transcript_31583/g.58231  ORF Transcript_31583/g.58231 Transcript_31583/m.58231 type:complete len:521 (-) Transcript_31583:73-1635(-)
MAVSVQSDLCSPLRKISEDSSETTGSATPDPPETGSTDCWPRSGKDRQDGGTGGAPQSNRRKRTWRAERRSRCNSNSAESDASKVQVVKQQQHAETGPVLLGQTRRDYDAGEEVDDGAEIKLKTGRNKISKSDAEHVPEQHLPSGAVAGQLLLSLLKKQDGPSKSILPSSEPQPLSTDEYQLWAMQAREDKEIGADALNAETFGDDHENGWSFEENLAANEALSHRSPGHDEVASPPAEIEATVRRLRRAVQDIAAFLNFEPWCLKEAVRYVAASGWSNITWRNSYTAMHLAAEFGQPETMPLLLALGGDPSVMDSNGRTAVDIAKEMQHHDCVDMLAKIEECSSIEEILDSGSGIEELLGAAPTCPEEESETLDLLQEARRLKLALCESAKHLDLEPLELRESVTRLVCYCVCDRAMPDSTAFHVAAKYDRGDVIPLIMSLGASPCIVDPQGRTAVDVANSRHHWGYAHMMHKVSTDHSNGGVSMPNCCDKNLKFTLNLAPSSAPVRIHPMPPTSAFVD